MPRRSGQLLAMLRQLTGPCQSVRCPSATSALSQLHETCAAAPISAACPAVPPHSLQTVAGHSMQRPLPLLQHHSSPGAQPCQSQQLVPSLSAWGHQQQRSVFGAPQQRENLQIHTHDKYKMVTPQPTYKWMQGRFVMDRNGLVWHKQSNQGKRANRTTDQLARLARWKALAPAYAAKFRKLPGVRDMLKYWQDPDPASVPGFEDTQPYKEPPRRNAKPDKRPKVGDPALRPH